nr:hypothetical protein [Tanacetum cinerariifolium]
MVVPKEEMIDYLFKLMLFKTLHGYNEGNECGNKPQLNIKGYSIVSSLTDRFMDFNSRSEFHHRLALISDDICPTSFAPVIEKAMTIIKKVKDSITCWSSLPMGRLQEVSILNMATVDAIVEASFDNFQAATKIVLDSWATDKDVQKALYVHQRLRAHDVGKGGSRTKR